MQKNTLKAIFRKAVWGAAVLFMGAAAALAQQQVNLAAGPASASLPDGTSVPMWGYTCGSLVANSTATCAALNPNSGSAWSPVVITVPTGQDLQINLTNNLPVVPTSLMIVGQVGGGLGDTTQRTTSSSPVHAPDTSATWSTVAPVTAAQAFTPPTQGPRVRSFGTEVVTGATAQLLWKAPRPGTYLIESGSHPSIQGPMGLYGILVVTAAPNGGSAGTAYPNVSYNSEVPLLFGEIDPAQNRKVNTVVNTTGFAETNVWNGQAGQCGDPNAPAGIVNTCYPPVVNYTPLYYTINGVAFSRANASASVFPAVQGTNIGTITGNVLVRMVNAGSRMHVPSIVGSTNTVTSSGGTKTTGGFALIAEDGNVLPGTSRVQNEVFMAAGKTYDVMINAPASTATALPIYDRELSLSANKLNRDAGMLAYISVNGSSLPSGGGIGGAKANPDSYSSVIPGQTLTISDAGKGVIANDINIYGVAVSGSGPTHGTVTLNPDGTFAYTPSSDWSGATPVTTADQFTYCGNGGTTACTTVSLGLAPLEANSGITLQNSTYASKVASLLKINSPGVLAGAVDAAGYPVKVALSTVKPATGLTLNIDPAGGFVASVSTPGTYTFTFQAQNSQGTLSAGTATTTLIFPQGSGLTVNVIDGQTKAAIPNGDYRWIIEEDRTFFIDPGCVSNPAPATSAVTGQPCLNAGTGIVPTVGVNFHTSDMPFVAQGCTGPKSCEAGQTVIDENSASSTFGQHVPAVCDIADGVCRTDSTAAAGQIVTLPSQVALDPTKRYYISVLPGDAADPFYGASTVGHSMGGAEIAAGQTSVTVLAEATPFVPARLSVFVFEDDFPLNGENDAGGGVDVLAPNEPGLGGFNLQLWDAMGGNGDFTGQMTYDMFNQPLGNSLAGTIDPASGHNACPIVKKDQSSGPGTGITGMIVTCPKYEDDGVTLSPLAGQAVVANLMPGRFGIVATPGADRIARGEEWHQTNTLDGQKAHDSFMRVGEPSYFQEFGPASYHVSIGFANPAIIQARLAGVCANKDPNLPYTGSCGNSISGQVSTQRMSRTPDERLYGSGNWDQYSWTQCYVSVGDPDGEDFAFTKCDANGKFSVSGLPDGDWRVTIFDKWNDLLVDGLSTPVALTGGTAVNMGEVAMTQWQANVYTKTFMDENKDGVAQANEDGISLVPVSVRYRDGSLANNLTTDFTGSANFNETFPLFNWYVVETDTTRYKNTGTHTVYDAGGPADGTTACGQTTVGYPKCGTSKAYVNMANTAEKTPLPADLSVPGSIYCPTADCTGLSIQSGSVKSAANSSTGRIDNPWMGAVEGWQGFSGQSNFIEFGKEPYVAGENGGIKGHVVYASTRPFDDPQMLVQTQWEPLVPHVIINLYQEGTAPDGTSSLKLVDTTSTSSWDDWAQGYRADGKPNMNCPGQSTADLFYFSIYDQPNYLDVYNHNHNSGPAPNVLPYNSQFKCYDGMHNWNQLQPAKYDGMYSFPSVTGYDANGKPSGTNCTICSANTAVPSSDLYYNLPMLPTGKYVVEVVVPQGYELVKEEDKNILIGDNFIAPVTQEFGSMGDIFILPDQASIASGNNPYNGQNATNSLGASPENGIVPGFIPEPVWPCVGAARVVPDYISLYPQSKQVSPFAGATRNLCDRKEVTLNDQAGAIAKFYIYTSTHIASKFVGVITDDFTSEFDPFSPQFGEKFSPPDLPVSIRDWTGAETNRVYADHWGIYNGMSYSTWEVNPPNPTGYSPTMMVTCMNDKGDSASPDPLYNSSYSQFCYELPYMPGQTGYFDTPVVPTAAFAEGYNRPDCQYPDATPAISSVLGDSINGGQGPWVAQAGNTLTINAVGAVQVNNYAYSGPSASVAPYNTKTITRNYVFGSTAGKVTIGGVPATVTNWTTNQITVTVPNNIPACTMQQQSIYGGSTAQCGELVVTSAGGKQSVDAVTVTVGGKAPTFISASTPVSSTGAGPIQQAIDASSPGDLLIVTPGNYKEMVLMWKPVRLQGVGAASAVIDANTQPAGKLDPWRRQVACLFGIALDGTPITASNPFDSTSTYSCPAAQQFSIDRLPLEATVGWDATLNGDLAELLQEPTLMGAYEGAGITVLAKGVNFPAGSNPFGSDTFPTGTVPLTAGNCLDTTGTTNPYPSSFWCNPSRIDGLTITDSSQGGGGIFAHAWTHNLEIANNRIFDNIGTLSGGINIGQGEFAPGYNVGAGALNGAPGSCMDVAAGPGISIVNPALVTNQELPYCNDINVNVHNNYITANESIGDEVFSATPAGAGGVSFCTGADFYKFNYNWVCGNMSTGDGGGISHLGLNWNGDIEHNTIIFNQSLNPTISTNGGGIQIQGTPDVDPTCGQTTDADCAPPGLSDGTGPGLIINANLLQGNAAESGSGGGLRLQQINGNEVSTFPSDPTKWNSAKVTNNVIVNNVAGWDGGGISIQDSIMVDIINNTIASNDTTATAGPLFNTLGAPMAGSPNATNTNIGTSSLPQPAGLVVMPHSPVLTAAIAGLTVTCPTNHPSCTGVSYPYLANDLFYQNRAFNIGVGALSATYEQNLVTIYNAFSETKPGSQTATGSCVSGSSYWDIGVRGDTGPGKHDSKFTLIPTYSLLTNASESTVGSNNLTGEAAGFAAQYCNGSRVPPEYAKVAGPGASFGWQVPPGISDATVPNPIFSLTPAATVDEGNNWINMSWGPLSMYNPITNALLGNYAPAAGSPAIDYIPSTSPTFAVAPSTDFYGNPRPDPSLVGRIDIGAVEYTGASPLPTLTQITPNVGAPGTTVKLSLTGTNFNNATSLTFSNPGITVSNLTVNSSTSVSATLTIAANAASGAGTVSITTPVATSNTLTFSVFGVPTMVSPLPGSVVSATQSFTWTSVQGVTSYGFWLSSIGPGRSDVYTSGWVPGTTVTATGLPTSGQTLYARLMWRVLSTTYYSDFTYIAGGTATPASMISPAAGSKLTSTTQTFTWTPGVFVSQYQLQISQIGVGRSELYASGILNTTSATVTGLPSTGITLYVRLFSNIGGTWQHVDYTYLASGTPTAAALVLPTPGTKLTGSSQAFSWSAGNGVTLYSLTISQVGPGRSDLFSSGYVNTTMVTVNNLPTTGGVLYVRLQSYLNGAWVYTDYTYTAAGTPAPATMISPAQGSTLTGSTQTFLWTSVNGAQAYGLWVSAIGPGRSDVYTSGTIFATTATPTNLPVNGKTLYVTVLTRVNGAWLSTNYTYTAF